MKKIFRKLHLWLGLPFGLILSLICFSGAMLSIEPEVTAWLQSDRQRVPQVLDERLPAHRLVENVAATIPDSVQVTGITFSADPTKFAVVSLSQPRRASVSVNPYTGEVMGLNKRVPFFFTMFRLHRWLLDSYKPDGFSLGKFVVGVSTLMFVFVLLSGLVIWWPKTRQVLSHRLTVKTRQGRHRLFHDLHVAGGFYALLLLLVMALTGLTWSFDWYRVGFYKVFGVEMAKGRGGHGGHGGGGQAGRKDRSSTTAKYPATVGVWEKAYQQVVADNADQRYQSITVADGEVSLALGGYGNQRAADQYQYDAETGKIVSVVRYADMDNAKKIQGWIYSAHTFTWGGWFTRIPALLAVLIGGILPLTGYYLWWKRRSRKRP